MYVQVRLAAWAGSRLPSSKAVPKARGSRRRREGQSGRGWRMEDGGGLHGGRSCGRVSLQSCGMRQLPSLFLESKYFSMKYRN